MPVGVPGPKKELSAERKFWLVLSDPCGLVCVIVTYLVVFFVDYMTVRNVLIPTYFASHTVVPYRYRWGMLHAGLFQCCIFMICWSHLKCMLSNPGTLTRIWPSQLLEKVKEISEIRKLQDKEYKEIGHYTKRPVRVPWCRKCDNYKPLHTHHCSTCGTCVENMDHHCPWMNNCVGKENHKFFMLFLLYVGLGSGYSIVMTGLRLYTCYASKKIGDMETLALYRCSSTVGSLSLIGYIVSIIFSFLFCLFVTCMCWEQLEEIADATTMIEKKQGLEAQRRGLLKGLEEVFQEKRSYRWFLPLKKNQAKYYFPELSQIFKVWGVLPTVMTTGIFFVWLYWCDIITRILCVLWNK
eukprot:g13257.t1